MTKFWVESFVSNVKNNRSILLSYNQKFPLLSPGDCSLHLNKMDRMQLSEILNAPRRDPFSPNFTYHLLIFELHSLDILNYNFSGYNRGIGLP